MLGRTADELFWMSRYVERAENMARLLEVGYRISLMPARGRRPSRRMALDLDECRLREGLPVQDTAGLSTTREVVNHHAVRRGQSLERQIEPARRRATTARAVRTALTRDLWESLNGTWNELARSIRRRSPPIALPGFLDWIKQRAMLFRGALLGTLLRYDTYYFSQLGTFIERADNTARILDVKYYILLPQPSDVGSELDSSNGRRSCARCRRTAPIAGSITTAATGRGSSPSS